MWSDSRLLYQRERQVAPRVRASDAGQTMAAASTWRAQGAVGNTGIDCLQTPASKWVNY